MNVWDAILLGLLQGLTEFLPVSSSGHLAIAQHYLPGFSQPGLAFDILLHLATMGAVVVYFRADLWRLATCLLRRTPQGAQDRRLLGLLALASLPTAVIGLLFQEQFEALFEVIPVVAALLLVTGTLLWLAERWRRRGRPLTQLTALDALIAGSVQGLAILPGISRSGSTIAALLLRGIDGEAAARFSFLMALPAVCGATLLALGDLDQLAASETPAYLAGAAVAFVAGMAAIRWLLAVIRRRRLFAFALYCWGVGTLFFAISLQG